MRATLLATVVLAAAGCPSDPCAEQLPAFGGLGNDEVWLTLRDAKARATTGGDAAVITSPTEGEVLSAPPQLAWDSPLKLSMSAPSPLVRYPKRSLLDALSELVIPSARAHLPPVSSDAYLVQLTVAGRACPVEIVTTEVSHTLDDESSALLEGDVTIDITSAYLDDGTVSEGPFASAPVTFRVEK